MRYRKWEYEMKFDSSFTSIVSGKVLSLGESNVPNTVHSFGTDLVYINARVRDWYINDSSLLSPSIPINAYFNQEGISDEIELMSMLEKVLFQNKCIEDIDGNSCIYLSPL